MARYLFPGAGVPVTKGETGYIYLPSGAWSDLDLLDADGRVMSARLRIGATGTLGDFYGPPDDTVLLWVELVAHDGTPRKYQLDGSTASLPTPLPANAGPRGLDGSAGPAGAAGAPGVAGPPGPAGAPGAGASFVEESFTFATPASRWVISNPSGGHPDVYVYDGNGDPWEVDVTYTATQIFIDWAWLQTGRAVIRRASTTA